MKQRRASSFGAVAREYDEHRPEYADAAVAWALAPVDEPAVLDLGAGTGKLTAAVLRVGVPPSAVTAVEPDDAMRAVLAAELPGVRALPGTAEAVPLGDGAVDAVLVGQAFHWFDPLPALDEIARVLRPGGVLAVTGNAEDDSVGWVSEVYDAVVATRPDGPPWSGGRFADVPGHPSFTDRAEHEVRWAWPRTVDAVLATLGTQSWALTSTPEQRAAAFDAVRSVLARTPETRSGRFDLPMTTTVVRLRRR